MKPTVVVLASAACLAYSSLSMAAPCSGFTDVDDSSVFCPNVDWLKNRAVTLGCTASTLYCPNEVVFRLSMAAFMNRLGAALTPVLLYNEASGASLDLDSPPQTVCATPQLPAAAYPRSAKASAVLTGNLSVPGTVGLRIVMSIDNGANWSPLNALPASVGGPNGWVNATVWKGDVPLAPGTGYRFGLRADRAGGTGTGDLGAWNCQLDVNVMSRLGATMPF
jgi:hypothetical protein